MRGASYLPVLGFHGCDAETATEVASGRTQLEPSDNDYDWLGPGIYFWLGSYNRALDWAVFKKSRGEIDTPDVVGAVIDLGNCLNLLNLDSAAELAAYYQHFSELCRISNSDVPINDEKFRRLDCAVIAALHFAKRRAGERRYDTVIGAFEEGAPAYSGSRIRMKSHVQIAVLNPDCVTAAFRKTDSR